MLKRSIQTRRNRRYLHAVAFALLLAFGSQTSADSITPEPRRIVDPIDMGRYHSAARLCVHLAKQWERLDRKMTVKAMRNELNYCFVAALPRA